MARLSKSHRNVFTQTPECCALLCVALAKQYDGIDKVCKGVDEGDDEGDDGRRLDTAAVGCGGASDAAAMQLSGSSHTEQALLAGAMALIIAATMM